MCKNHEQVHLRIEQSLSHENYDEFNQGKRPEEDAYDIDSALHIEVFLAVCLISLGYRYKNVLGRSLENYSHCHNLEDKTNEFCLLQYARIRFHFELNLF